MPKVGTPVLFLRASCNMNREMVSLYNERKADQLVVDKILPDENDFSLYSDDFQEKY